MARRRGATTTTDDEQLTEIEAWYRDRLTRPAVLPVTPWQPVRIGPTWQIEDGHWLLPEASLGWGVLAWCGRWLAHRGQAWQFTDEQARFVLWWYAVLPSDGSWLYRDGVMQRLKGHGKDPLGACIGTAEMLGPVRLVDWNAGRPVGAPVEDAWVQIAATALEQTKTTMRLLPSLISREAVKAFQLQVGKEQVYGCGSTRLLQAVTSSPATLEGARSTFTMLNETHHWLEANGGHDMASVISRNAAKSTGGSARSLRFTNAYEPGENSVAEQDREAWEAVQDGRAVDVGLLYDSLEAPPEAPLTVEDAPAVVESIRGDSVWLSTTRIVAEISDVRNPPSRSRRFWYNQIVAAEDAWMSPQAFDRLARPDLKLAPSEAIALFFDGSKSDDSSGLVGCRIADGHLVTLGVWQRPPGERGLGWTAPREAIDARVEETWERYTVSAMFADPSDTRDDDGSSYWGALVDLWHRRYAARIEPKLWAVAGKHAIAWDMRTPQHQQQFTDACERYLADVEGLDLTHDGHPTLRQHHRNARRRPNRYGVAFGKEHRESSRKVDLAVCSVGARMLARAVRNLAATQRPRSGKVW